MIPKGLLKIRQIPILMRLRYGTHVLSLAGLSKSYRKFYRKLDGEK
jgi:hypothetical protein